MRRLMTRHSIPLGRILGIPIGLDYSWFLAPRRSSSSPSPAQVMPPLDQLKRIGPDPPLWSALQQMDRDGVNQLPVTRDNRVFGMLSREGVITFLGTLRELGS